MKLHLLLTLSLFVASLEAGAIADTEINNQNQAVEESLPKPPTEQELIDLQTQLRAPYQENLNVWSFFGNSCKYAIRVPDAVTRGTIALTFDDGPDPVTTPMVLSVLRAHKVKATFFVLGGKIPGNEPLLRHMVKEGHMLGNHSYSHANFHDLSSSKSRAEIAATDHLLHQFEIPEYFRFPYGNSTCSADDTVKALGYKIVGWNIDSCDWAYADGYVSDKENKTCRAPESLRSDFIGYVLKQVSEIQGGVILMHDVHLKTAQNLDRLLSILERKGYKFVTLDDPNIFANLNFR
ncbi:MAG: polysaccharide deacetylase family protein [Bdellovibrio sp.]